MKATYTNWFLGYLIQYAFLNVHSWRLLRNQEQRKDDVTRVWNSRKKWVTSITVFVEIAKYKKSEILIDTPSISVAF